MAIDPTAVGAEGKRRTISWTSRDALLYAVGIGAAQDDLAFSTENSIGLTQQVYPTFAVVEGMSAESFETTAISKVGTYDMSKVVHGSQAITLHRPIPPVGTASTIDRVAAMYDKGKATVIVTEYEATLETGEPLWTMRASTFIRDEGGWGGERGPSGPQNEPPDRAPDFERTMQTSEDQAYVYRLSGDRNPLHSDPAFAKKAGFDRPILHGLCTYGFSGRALLRALCADDVTRFRHIEGRFSAPVLPGEALTVRAWNVEDGATVFTTSVDDRIVIDQGLMRFA